MQANRRNPEVNSGHIWAFLRKCMDRESNKVSAFNACSRPRVFPCVLKIKLLLKTDSNLHASIIWRHLNVVNSTVSSLLSCPPDLSWLQLFKLFGWVLARTTASTCYVFVSIASEHRSIESVTQLTPPFDTVSLRSRSMGGKHFAIFPSQACGSLTFGIWLSHSFNHGWFYSLQFVATLIFNLDLFLLGPTPLRGLIHWYRLYFSKRYQHCKPCDLDTCTHHLSLSPSPTLLAPDHLT